METLTVTETATLTRKETPSLPVLLQSAPENRGGQVILRTSMKPWDCAIAIKAANKTNFGYQIDIVKGLENPILNITDPHQQGGVLFFATFAELMR
mgnify:FL=1